MEIQYQIYPEYRLLIQRYVGVFNFEQYTKYVNSIMSDPTWESVEKVLLDLTELEEMVMLSDLPRLLAVREGVVRKKILSVFLVDKPRQTAFAHLYQDKLEGKSMSALYCSTLVRAEGILGLTLTAGGLDEMLESLSGKY